MTLYVLLEFGTFVFAVISVAAIVFNAVTEGDYMKWVIPIVIISFIAGFSCPFVQEIIKKENTTSHVEVVQMEIKRIVEKNDSPNSEIYLILFDEKNNKEIEIKAAPGWIDYSKNVVDVEIITTTFFDETSQQFKIKGV